jgi:hypothetical protein
MPIAYAAPIATIDLPLQARQAQPRGPPSLD